MYIFWTVSFIFFVESLFYTSTTSTIYLLSRHNVSIIKLALPVSAVLIITFSITFIPKTMQCHQSVS